MSHHFDAAITADHLAVVNIPQLPHHHAHQSMQSTENLTSPKNPRPARPRWRILLATAAATIFTQHAHAQWSEESFSLKSGWSAIWLSIDCTHDSIDNLVATTPEIEEIWRWNPLASTDQFTDNPAEPVLPDTQWDIWRRGFPVDSTLSQLSGNAAYLVKSGTNVPAFTLTGKPQPPRYTWKSSGVNFFGFPTPPGAPSSAINIDRFFSFNPDFTSTPAVYAYVGGPLAPDVNPQAVATPRNTPLTRGQAFWVESTDFTTYYAPLRVSILTDAIDFGDTGSIASLRIKNTTAREVTATLTPAESATPPAGQPPIAGQVPLKTRGEFDPGPPPVIPYIPLDTPYAVTLAPGESREIALTVDRIAMAGSPGDVFQSLLQVTDDLGLMQVNLPVRAETASPAGLWVGTALINTVDQVDFEPDADTPSQFPLRLLLHRDGTGTVRLLQSVFLGQDVSGETILATRQEFLDPLKLTSAKRLSSSVFPAGGVFDNSSADSLSPEASLSFTVTLAADSNTNPFLHLYHPDHGPADSLTFSRRLSLEFTPDPAVVGVGDLDWGSAILGGRYRETLTGVRSTPFDLAGLFIVRRLSPISNLVTQ